MLTAKEFNQLIEILPRLEEFVRAHQLTSLSLIKIPFSRKPADLYLYYTHDGETHGLDITSQIGQDFKELWHIPVDSDIVCAQEKNFLDLDIYNKHLRNLEFFIVSIDTNQNYIIATPAQIIDYAMRQFDISLDQANNPATSENPKKRRFNDEIAGRHQMTPLVFNNIFMKKQSQNSVQTIEEQIDNLSLDECKKYLRHAIHQ